MSRYKFWPNLNGWLLWWNCCVFNILCCVWLVMRSGSGAERETCHLFIVVIDIIEAHHYLIWLRCFKCYNVCRILTHDQFWMSVEGAFYFHEIFCSLKLFTIASHHKSMLWYRWGPTPKHTHTHTHILLILSMAEFSFVVLGWSLNTAFFACLLPLGTYRQTHKHTLTRGRTHVAAVWRWCVPWQPRCVLVVSVSVLCLCFEGTN